MDEWALADVAPLRNATAAQITHIPWWHFARFYEAALPISADIVVCDAALGEMDHFAFRYVARIAKMLTEQSETGCLLYQNLGEERIQQRAYAEQYFSNVGFRLHKIGEVSVLVGSEQFPTGEIKDMKEPPPIGGDQGMQAPADFLDIDRASMLESYRFFDFIGIGR